MIHSATIIKEPTINKETVKKSAMFPKSSASGRVNQNQKLSISLTLPVIVIGGQSLVHHTFSPLFSR